MNFNNSNQTKNQNASSNSTPPNQDWMNDPSLENIDKSKLNMFMALAEQSNGKSQKDLIPFMMAAASKTKQQGNTFSSEETDIIIDVLKQGKSQVEIQNIEKIKGMLKMMNL